MNITVCLFVWVDALRPRSKAEVMSGRSVMEHSEHNSMDYSKHNSMDPENILQY